jgi:hypothetical protein
MALLSDHCPFDGTSRRFDESASRVNAMRKNDHRPTTTMGRAEARTSEGAACGINSIKREAATAKRIDAG